MVCSARTLASSASKCPSLLNDHATLDRLCSKPSKQWFPVKREVTGDNRGVLPVSFRIIEWIIN